MNDKRIGNCLHEIEVKKGTVCLFNESDPFYTTEFNNEEEVKTFCAEMMQAASDAFVGDDQMVLLQKVK